MRFTTGFLAAAATLALTIGAAQAEDMMKLKIGTEGAIPSVQQSRGRRLSRRIRHRYRQGALR